MNATLPGWDATYERRVVCLLALGFGLVGLDRSMVAPLFPHIMRDLHLDYQDLGNLVGVVGLTWGVSSVFTGGLSDRIGRRRVLLPAMVAFSLLAGLSGVVSSLTALLAIRALLGAAEGSYCPTSFAATNDASKPSRRGFNLGLQQSAFPLLGLALGPIIATRLLEVFSWRSVFVIVALPGLIVAGLLARTLREPAAPSERAPDLAAASIRPAHFAVQPMNTASRPRLRVIFSQRNVIFGMLALFCAMSELFTVGAMIPSYLIDYLHLTGPQMGTVASAVGLGGCLGQVCLPGLSDLIGRKSAALAGFLAALVALYVFSRLGPQPVPLFASLFCTVFFCCGLIGLITGPLAAEAAPQGLTSTTTGIIVGAGEIFGGGAAPALAGAVAQRFGIQYTLNLSMGAMAIGLVVGLFLRETAPLRVGPVTQQGDCLRAAASGKIPP